jgi:membrane-anchored glycerophosphoryl diester phosphodiesterase (GDPDase)
VAYASVAPPNLLDRALSPAQARWFFLLALLAFVLPFILADYRYVDDNWRAQLDVQSTWRHEGRLLVELFYRALTFSGLSIDVFPLPLLLACAA